MAVLNGVMWSLITPAFQTPDEPVQAGYVQYLAETGHLPQATTPYWRGSPEEDAAFGGVLFSFTAHPSWSSIRNAAVERQLASSLGRTGPAEAGYAAALPPLYFALATIPYRVASGGNFYDRLFAVRIMSALLAGATVAFTFLFLRELLPRRRFAWTAGSLAVALQPTFGFMAGGVDYDNLLWVESAALLWLLARAFRRGLDLWTGLGIGAALALGLATKGSTWGLVPGAAFAIAALVVRAPAGRRRRALLGAAAAVAALLVYGGWLEIGQLTLHRSATTSAATGVVSAGTSIGGQLDYLWQFFLPRLGFMNHTYFWTARYPNWPLWQVYFQGFVGRFGWFAFGFPLVVNIIAVGALAALLALAGHTLLRARAAVRSRWLEVACYALLSAGVVLVVAVAGYRYRVQTGQNFEQTRYLFPLLPLYGALVALAVRGAGRRWEPVVGAVIVAVALAHGIFSQLLALGHYYA